MPGIGKPISREVVPDSYEIYIIKQERRREHHEGTGIRRMEMGSP